jgi:hypothetical protein
LFIIRCYSIGDIGASGNRPRRSDRGNHEISVAALDDGGAAPGQTRPWHADAPRYEVVS